MQYFSIVWENEKHKSGECMKSYVVRLVSGTEFTVITTDSIEQLTWSIEFERCIGVVDSITEQ